MISFGKRIALAFSAWFSILGSGELPDDVVGALVRPPEPARPAPAPLPLSPPPPPPAAPDPVYRAVQILALLQRDGRLIDFLMEDLAPYADGQIGAAVRDVHAGSRQALERYFTLQPVLDDEEGRPITVERGIDPASVKIVGNAAGPLPLRGVLRHRGWDATRIDLPPLPATGRTIVAPAEVEVS